jgi:hypothetical protein
MRVGGGSGIRHWHVDRGEESVDVLAMFPEDGHWDADRDRLPSIGQGAQKHSISFSGHIQQCLVRFDDKHGLASAHHVIDRHNPL